MEELGRRVERWVEAGVIGREQGDAILALEAEPGGGRRAVAVEVLGYLGGGLALVAGFVIGTESWDQLGYWGRVGALAVVTGALLGPGGGCAGAVWLELGRRRLVEPRRTSEALGALGLVAGAEALATVGLGAGDGLGQGGWGLWLGLGVAVALVVAGSALRRAVPLGLGVAAMVVFLGQVAAEYWQDLGAPLAILLVGLGLVAAAALLARLRPAGTRTHPAGTRDR